MPKCSKNQFFFFSKKMRQKKETRLLINISYPLTLQHMRKCQQKYDPQQRRFQKFFEWGNQIFFVWMQNFRRGFGILNQKTSKLQKKNPSVWPQPPPFPLDTPLIFSVYIFTHILAWVDKKVTLQKVNEKEVSLVCCI